MQVIKNLLTANVKNNLKSLLIGKNWVESAYFSQMGEDVLLRNYFPREKRQGFFVDVGAFLPVALSNTYYFYLKGWRGINIEPNPNGIAAFKKYRPEDINLQIGIASAPGILKYHMIADKPFENSFSQQQVHARHGDNPNEKVIEVPVDTLKNVLEKYVPTGQEIDFISIDVEGLNLEVLSSHDWQRHRPKVVVIEKHLPTEQEKNLQMIALMANASYKLDHDILHSYFFVEGNYFH